MLVERMRCLELKRHDNSTRLIYVTEEACGIGNGRQALGKALRDMELWIDDIGAEPVDVSVFAILANSGKAF